MPLATEKERSLAYIRFPDGRRELIRCNVELLAEGQEATSELRITHDLFFAQFEKRLPKGTVILGVFSQDISDDPAKPATEYSSDTVVFPD